MTGIIEFSTDTLNIEVSGINDNIPVDLVEVISTGQDVYVNVESNYGPVLAVNGRIGFVTLNKSDVGLSNVENVSITGVSGYLQYQIDNLDTGYASQTEINLLSGLLGQTGSYLYTTITNLSGDIVSNYATKIELGNTGVFLQNLINALSGYGNGAFATITNLAATGLNLNNKIDTLSGYSNNTFATITNLASTGQNLQNQINNLDLNYASQTEFNSLSGNLISTGANLQSQINSLYGSGFLTGVDLSPYYLKSNPSGFITGVNLSNYVTKTNGQFSNRPTVNGTGIFLSGDIFTNVYSPIFATPGESIYIISGHRRIYQDIFSYYTTGTINIYLPRGNKCLIGDEIILNCNSNGAKYDLYRYEQIGPSTSINKFYTTNNEYINLINLSEGGIGWTKFPTPYLNTNPSGFITSVQGVPSGGLGGQVLVKSNEYQDYLTNWKSLNAQDVNAAERFSSVYLSIPSGADNAPIIGNMIDTGVSVTNNIYLTGTNKYYRIVKYSHNPLQINLPTSANFGDRIAIRRDEPVVDENKGAMLINRLGGIPYTQTISVLPRNGNIFYCIWIGIWVADFVPPAGFEGAPSSPTSFGVPGQMAYEEPYLYICVNNNQWRRIAISDWS